MSNTLYRVSYFQNINNSSSDDALMKASNDVIDALRRTTGLMQGELERSVLTTQMLGMCFVQYFSTFTNHCP